MKKKLIAISSVIEELFSKKSSQFSEIYFLSQLNQSWKKLSGGEISQQAKPIQFKKQILFLQVPDSTYIQEMHFVKEALKNKINQKFPEYKVKKIILKT